jgi:hypothetical protein
VQRELRIPRVEIPANQRMETEKRAFTLEKNPGFSLTKILQHNQPL